MAELQLRPRVDDAELQRALRRGERGAGRVSRLWPAFARRIRSRWAQAFRREGTPRRRWTRYSPGYAAWRQRHAPGPMLVLSGAYRRSLLHAAAGSVNVVTGRQLRVGSRVPHAHLQERGHRRRGGGRRVPRRSVLIWIDRDEREIMAGQVAALLDADFSGRPLRLAGGVRNRRRRGR